MTSIRHRKVPSPQPSFRPESTVNRQLRSISLPPYRLLPLYTADYAIIALFLFLAALTRLYRIAEPPAVVFDELHFSKFTDRLQTGTWFFDIHPPLGKLILAFGSRLLGYRPDPTFVINKIGDLYPTHVNYVLVRYISATFSILTVPLTYIISRQLLLSRIASILPTTATLLDFLGVIEGRLILMDSQLLFFCQLALSSALILWRTRPDSRARTVSVVATGLIAGAAFSIKHTALATPGLIAIISFFGLHFAPAPLTLSECGLAGLCGLTVYTIPFYIMFHLLWKTGGKYDAFMPLHFRKTLINGTDYDPTARRAMFPRLFVYLNWRMIASNANIKKRHTWESDWYQWIVNWRGLLYFLKKEDVDGVQMRTQIYLLGNPVVSWTVLVAVLIFLTLLATSIRYRQRLWAKVLSRDSVQWARGNGIFVLCGWLCNLLPYILVDRAAFIYHYLPGLFYGELLCGVLVDLLPKWMKIGCVSVLCVLMAVAFVYWSPWIYAFAMTNEEHNARRWLPRWT